MSVWSLSDLHLAFGVPEKTMEVFGPFWHNYAEKIESHWKQKISSKDLILIPGDISWAKHLEQALVDLKWIDALPGTKVILRGNHDYWWSSASKLSKIMPPSIHFIQNNVFIWNDIAIGGSRLWDTSEYHFDTFIEFQENLRQRLKTSTELEDEKEENERIFVRELERLKLSLSQISSKSKIKIAMAHYPPIGPDLAPSRASQILESFHIDYCVFGHLHNVRKGALPFGEARGVKYLFTSCDYLDFIPLKVYST